MLALAAQFALPRGATLPEAPSLAPRRLKAPVAAEIPDYPDVLHAPIFAPDRAAGEAALGGAEGVAQTLQLVGLAVSGRSVDAVVHTPDGATQVLEPGQALQGWRLVAAASGHAVFVGPAGRVVLTVGGAEPTPALANAPAGPQPGPTPKSEHP